jgi:drug/metabolite transporter (DMT)-like permease
MFFVGNGLVAIAAREVPSGVTALSIGSVPLFLTAMEAAFGVRPSKRQWAGMALGFVGVICMGASTADVSSASLWLLTLAPIGWASASLLVRRADLPAGLMAGAAQLLAGGASSLIAGLILGERFTAVPSASALSAFAYLVVLGSLVAYSAALHLLRNAPAAVATSYAYVNPVLALALGTSLAGERLSPNTVLSGLLVISGVALLLLNQPER